MKIISTTINYNGYPIKIEGGKIYFPSFGTTIYNHSIHWSYVEVKQSDLKDDFINSLKEKGFID